MICILELCSFLCLGNNACAISVNIDAFETACVLMSTETSLY